MKWLMTTFFALAILITILSGCQNIFEKVKSGSNSDAITNNDRSEEPLNIVNSEDNLEKEIVNDEDFYGEWIIKQYYPFTGVTEYSVTDAEKLLGKRIIYSYNSVSFDEKSCNAPCFYIETVSKKDFEELNYYTFQQLNLETESIAAVDVYTDKDLKSLWDSIGSSFLIKDKNNLILFEGGVYFDLVRVN